MCSTGETMASTGSFCPNSLRSGLQAGAFGRKTRSKQLWRLSNGQPPGDSCVLFRGSQGTGSEMRE